MLYKVYFEIGGYKMQKKVEVNNKYEAQSIVASSIKFYDTIVIENTPKQTLDNPFGNLFSEFFGSNKTML